MTDEIYNKLATKLNESGYVFYYLITDKIKQIAKGPDDEQAKQNLFILIKKHSKLIDKNIYRCVLKLYKPKHLNDTLVNGIISINIKKFKINEKKLIEPDYPASKIIWVPSEQHKIFKIENIKMIVKAFDDEKIDLNPLKIVTIKDIKKMNIVFTGRRILKFE